jgi:hypothetical protein
VCKSLESKCLDSKTDRPSMRLADASRTRRDGVYIFGGFDVIQVKYIVEVKVEWPGLVSI